VISSLSRLKKKHNLDRHYKRKHKDEYDLKTDPEREAELASLKEKAQSSACLEVSEQLDCLF